MRKGIFIGHVLLAGALSLAAFASDRTTPSKKGSLLIFPYVDVTDLKTTLIRITNDYTAPVDVMCYYLDRARNRLGFQFNVAKNQPIWFDAATGQGTLPTPSFPHGGSRVGALQCWAVTPGGGSQIDWNHLSGSATIYDFANRTAWEYSSWNFAAVGTSRGDSVGEPGIIRLDGAVGGYDSCPQYLLGYFTPLGTNLALGAEDITIQDIGLQITGCTQNLRQSVEVVYTRLDFTVWNEDEVRFGGAYECAGSWHGTLLSDIDVGAMNFLFSSLGSRGAYYRVEAVADDQCSRVNRLPSRAVGIVGVQSTFVSYDGQAALPKVHGANLNAAGTRAGHILWEPAEENPPEILESLH